MRLRFERLAYNLDFELGGVAFLDPCPSPYCLGPGRSEQRIHTDEVSKFSGSVPLLVVRAGIDWIGIKSDQLKRPLTTENLRPTT